MPRLIDANKLIGDLHNHAFLEGDDREIVYSVIQKQPTIGGWISVKDGLPERYERILTYDKYSGVKENWLLCSCPCVSWSYGFHVTHWMPMPEPPKEVKQND